MPSSVLRVCVAAVLVAACVFASDAEGEGKQGEVAPTKTGDKTDSPASTEAGAVDKPTVDEKEQKKDESKETTPKNEGEKNETPGKDAEKKNDTPDQPAKLPTLDELESKQESLNKKLKDSKDKAEKKKLNGQLKWLKTNIPKLKKGEPKGKDKTEMTEQWHQLDKEDKVPKNAAAVAGLMLAVASSLLALLAF